MTLVIHIAPQQEKRIDILCLRAKEQTSTQFLPVVGDIEITPELLLPPPPPYERLSHIFFRKAIAPLMAKLPVKISIVTRPPLFLFLPTELIVTLGFFLDLYHDIYFRPFHMGNRKQPARLGAASVARELACVRILQITNRQGVYH